ncbi:MAG: hypothetical protein WB902_17810, partial [Acetobacteraceae bacterium]
MRGREWHVVGHYRLGQPFESQLANFFEWRYRFHTDGDPLGDEDLPILSLGAEPGSEIAYGANRRVSGAIGKADLAERCIALRDADAGTAARCEERPPGAPSLRPRPRPGSERVRRHR